MRLRPSTLNEGRTQAKKRAFYKAVADGLYERLQPPREDVLVQLVAVKNVNWSLGNGDMPYG